MASASINETHAVKDASCGRYAAILAIGTAVPPTIVDQSTYHEYYFRVTNADHHSDESKQKLKRMCAKSAIRKRHTCLSPDILKANPSICSFEAPSLSERMEIAAEVIPQMAADAATKAIKEWGRPATDITHLVFTTTTGAIHIPGPDYQLVKLLGLRPTVQRVMIPTQGCFGGVAALRVAKDIAENRRGMNQQGGSGAARVLVVCSESTAIFFNGPNEERPDQLVLFSLFGDGAGAMVVGADPVEGIESDPIFETLSTSQMIIPDTEFALNARMKESGLRCKLIPQVPHIIADHIGGFLNDLLLQVSEPHDGSLDWNSFFWVLHPGGRAIVDQVEQRFCLHPEKLEVTRHVLAEYGNMLGATVIFELDEMRRRSAAGGMCSTGEGKELGLLVAMGPGITLEAAVLRSVPHKLAKP